MKYIKLFEALEDDKYKVSLKPTLNYHEATFNGYEISDITCSNINLQFDIIIEHRTWGIDGVYIANISGPSEIEIEVEYYIDDEVKSELINISIDWEKINIEKITDKGVITITEIEFDIVNDPKGNLYADKSGKLIHSGKLIINNIEIETCGI